MRMMATAMILAAAALLTGCIQQEADTEIVLEKDGSVTWIHREWAVRSDSESARDRAEEQDAWLATARSVGHPACRGLELLGAEDVSQELLREEPPMEVRVVGRFATLSDLGDGLMSVLQAQGEQRLETEGSVVRWTLHVAPLAGGDEGPDLPDEDENALVALVSDEKPTFALAAGRFVEVQGFELSGDRTRATLLSPDGDDAEEHGLTLVLAWDPTR